MAKKKSKGFIIPAIHFLTTSTRQKKSQPPVPAPMEKPRLKAPASSEKPGPVADAAILKTNLETQKPTLEKKHLAQEPRSRRKSALSLSSLKRNRQEEEEKKRELAAKQDQTDLPQDSFDQAKFDIIWKNYIEELHRKGEKILASILSADHPRIEDQMIHVTYPNKLMKKELLKVRPGVLKDLREKLNNYAVDFKIEVKEENVKRFAYTPQEKYELLREKNQDLSLLRKTFNLEL